MPAAGVMDATEDVAEPSSGDILPPGGPGHRYHLAMYAALAIAGVTVLAVAAGVAWNRHTDKPTAPTPAVASLPLITVDPPAGATGINPNSKVTLSANRGRLTTVHLVDTDGKEITGDLDPLGRSWVSTAYLRLAKDYKLTAEISGVNKGTKKHPAQPVARTSEFSTVKPTGLLTPFVTPGDNQTVGIGAPIVIRFQSPVTNRNAITPLLSVSMSKPVDGAWHWFGAKEVHYRPKDYWPAGEQITMVAKLTNVDAGNNVWGDIDRTVTFKIGDAHVSTVDVDAHTMTVSSNGQVLRTLPISAGRDKYPTMSGIHIALEKSYHVVMDSSTVGIPVNSPDGYKEDVYWNVAITNGGEYVHAAPWSVGAQGSRNVSHGCVNLSTDDAKWFYGFSQTGDIINIVGSPRGPSTSDAGTADWNIPWDQWVQPVA